MRLAYAWLYRRSVFSEAIPLVAVRVMGLLRDGRRGLPLGLPLRLHVAHDPPQVRHAWLAIVGRADRLGPGVALLDRLKGARASVCPSRSVPFCAFVCTFSE